MLRENETTSNKRLRELRKILKLTQSQMGESIKLSKASIGNIENGLINLTDRNIDLICSVHNVNKEWIKNGTGEIFMKISKDEELSYLMGALLSEDCDYKKQFIRDMLELESKEDWELIAALVKRLKRAGN